MCPFVHLSESFFLVCNYQPSTSAMLMFINSVGLLLKLVQRCDFSCRMQVASCRVQVAGSRLQIKGCRLKVSELRLKFAC